MRTGLGAMDRVLVGGGVILRGFWERWSLFGESWGIMEEFGNCIAKKGDAATP